MTSRVKMTCKTLVTLLAFALVPAVALAQWTGADYGLSPNTGPAGYQAVGDANPTPGINQIVSTHPHAGGTFTATLSSPSASGLEFRNRATVTGPNGDMFGDLVGTRNAGGGQMTLVFSGLPDGWFRIRTWHNDADPGGTGFATDSTFNVSLNGTVMASNVTASNTTSPPQMANANFNAQVIGGSDLTVDFTHVAYDPSVAQHTVLSGWRITRLDYWKSASGGTVPSGAFVGGTNSAGQDIYVCRAADGQALIPGRINPQESSPGCRYTKNGASTLNTSDYGVLQDAGAAWESWGGSAPANVIIGGNGSNGNPRYICQTSDPRFPGTMIPGKVRDDGTCEIIYSINASNPDGLVHTSSSFNVLVQN